MAHSCCEAMRVIFHSEDLTGKQGIELGILYEVSSLFSDEKPHYMEISDVTRSTPEVSGRIVTLAQKQTPTCHNHSVDVIRTHDVAGQIQLLETPPWVFNEDGKLTKAKQSLWTI